VSDNNKPMSVGGQAILEGVMMRSPNSMAVVCRKGDGQIVLKEQQWISLWHRLKFLRWPFLRGTEVLIEALWNGISALTFSANLFSEEEDKKAAAAAEKNGEAPKKAAEKKETKPLTSWAITATIFVSMLFAIGLFVVLPHYATIAVGWLVGHELTVDMVLFHAVDGVIKIAVFLAYVWGISFMPDIRRVFEYHGAEHKTIFAFDDGKELTLANVRPYTTFHPRCGTSFIIIVLLASILLFSLAFPLLPKFEGLPKLARNFVFILIKLPLLLPIAGISYELIKLAGKYRRNPLLKLAVLPGLLTQRITTKPPSDDMLEIAILSLKKCLWREQRVREGAATEESEITYPDFATAAAELGTPEFLFKGGACDVQ